MSLKKDVDNLRAQIKIKMSNFMSKPFLPFALDIVDFVEKVVNKLESLDNRLNALEAASDDRPYNEKN